MKGLIWLPNNDEITLAKYRMEKAKYCLKASKLLLDDGLYADSANRFYYAIFHSMNVLCALRSVEYKNIQVALACRKNYGLARSFE